jgi:hypothetical protein
LKNGYSKYEIGSMISMRKYAIGLLLIIIIISAIGIAGKEQAKQIQKVNAELDIFSGRPNPSWELSSEEISDLARYMAGLTPAIKPAVPGDLGYRGFVISNPGKIAGLPANIHVFSGILAVTEKGSTSYYNDVNNIESWLIERAKEHGYGDVISETIQSKKR